jgi:hypothetical protein
MLKAAKDADADEKEIYVVVIALKEFIKFTFTYFKWNKKVMLQC